MLEYVSGFADAVDADAAEDRPGSQDAVDADATEDQPGSCGRRQRGRRRRPAGLSAIAYLLISPILMVFGEEDDVTQERNLLRTHLRLRLVVVKLPVKLVQIGRVAE